MFKKEERYLDWQQEGDVYSLDEYLLENGVDPSMYVSDQRKVSYIEDELGAKVVMRGQEPVVVVLAGRSKVRVGYKQAIGRQKAWTSCVGRKSANWIRTWRQSPDSV